LGVPPFFLGTGESLDGGTHPPFEAADVGELRRSLASRVSSVMSDGCDGDDNSPVGDGWEKQADVYVFKNISRKWY